MTEKETLSWQTLLAKILKGRRERERIARDVGVTTHTLNRWAKPGYQLPEVKQQILLQALPKTYRSTIQELMQKERMQKARERPSIKEVRDALPDAYRTTFDELVKPSAPLAHEEVKQEERPVIAEVFYRLAVDGACKMEQSLQMNGIVYLSLQQIVGSLDPAGDPRGRRGMMAFAYKCEVGEDQLVRVLRKIQTMGSGPFEHIAFASKEAFAGATSIAGQAVISQKELVIGGPERLVSLGFAEGGSLLAFPFLRRNRVAGALVLYCPRLSSPSLERQKRVLLEYAQLIAALAFSEKDFYAPSQIALVPLLPSDDFQVRLTIETSQLLFRLREAAERSGQERTIQEIEDELLAILKRSLLGEED